MSLPEAMVLSMVHYAIPLQGDRFLAWTLREFDHFPEWTVTTEQIGEAVASLIAKGYLRVLTPHDVTAARLSYSTYDRYLPSHVGLLDWTRAGRRFARRLTD